MLTFADGYTKRANSATFLPGEAGDPRKSLEAVAQAYREQGLPAIFRITPLTFEFGIDRILDLQQFSGFDETCVQTLDLADARFLKAADVTLAPMADQVWRSALAAAQDLDETKTVAMGRILDRIQDDTIYATAFDAGDPAAWGVAVVAKGMMGLFNIVTDRKRRARGNGGRLVRALLDAGFSRGARHAYLQVTATNAAANHLYGGLGFKEFYRYHYRRSS